MECSDFFRSHEVIGSSLLFVHDRKQANVWLIDFAKTVQLPENHLINHSSTWKVGNHEDGYLIGINNLIDIYSELEMEITTATSETNSNSNSLTPSSGSSPTSLSPKRSVSESNVEDVAATSVGTDKAEIDLAGGDNRRVSDVTVESEKETEVESRQLEVEKN